MKLGSPDYVNRDSDEATEDFMRRIECYENSYESLDEDLDRWVREPHGLQLALRGWGSPLGHLSVAPCGGSVWWFPKGGGLSGKHSRRLVWSDHFCFFPWGRSCWPEVT